MKRLLIIPLIFTAFSLFAVPIGEDKAREIATSFFAAHSTRSSALSLGLEWADSDIATIDNTTRLTANSAEPLIYIYNRTDSDGFVIVAGDDKVSKPVVAFSLNNTFERENMPDGAKEILQAWCKQIEVARYNNTVSTSTDTSTFSTLNIVCSYETALWGQGAPFNDKSPIRNGSRVPCGCVATAAGIVCCYHQWPEKGVGTIPSYTYIDDSGKERLVVENKLGHTYDYSLLKMDYRSGYTKDEGTMVATLLYDLGTAFKMNFDEEGSGANSFFASQSMAEYFGYSKSSLFIYHKGHTEEEWTAMLQKNLSEYGPMLFSGKSNSSGHAFVLDGYTDDGYFGINYGWNGKSNGYYLLPEITYYKNQAALFYLEPDRDGTSKYREFLTLGSRSDNIYRGIYTDATEYMVGDSCNATIRIINRGLGVFNGTFCIAHCDKKGNIKQVLCEANRELAANKIFGKKYSITIKDKIEEGDRLRVFYKGANSSEWTRALRDDDIACDEVLLLLTPTEVARSLNLSYDKESRTMTFNSEHAIQYSVTNESGSVVYSGKGASFTPTEINLSSLKSGKYTFSFASGGEPCKLLVIL